MVTINYSWHIRSRDAARMLGLGLQRGVTSGNRRKMLCLQRKTGISAQKEVSKIVSGDMRPSWGFTKHVHEEEKEDGSYWRPYPVRDRGTHLPTCYLAVSGCLRVYTNSRCCRGTHLKLVQPSNFICCSSMLPPWYYCGEPECIMTAEITDCRVCGTNAQGVFSDLSGRGKDGGSKDTSLKSTCNCMAGCGTFCEE